jgi:hypothetical protein
MIQSIYRGIEVEMHPGNTRCMMLAPLWISRLNPNAWHAHS